MYHEVQIILEIPFTRRQVSLSLSLPPSLRIRSQGNAQFGERGFTGIIARWGSLYLNAYARYLIPRQRYTNLAWNFALSAERKPLPFHCVRVIPFNLSTCGNLLLPLFFALLVDLNNVTVWQKLGSFSRKYYNNDVIRVSAWWDARVLFLSFSPVRARA